MWQPALVAIVIALSTASAQAASENSTRGTIVKNVKEAGKDSGKDGKGDQAEVNNKGKGKDDKGKDDKGGKGGKGRVTRIIPSSITACSVYPSNGLSAKPAQTHVTRSDKARVRAEAKLLQTATMAQSDLVTYYGQILGPDSFVPEHDKYRVSDRNGPKKTCMPSPQ